MRSGVCTCARVQLLLLQAVREIESEVFILYSKGAPNPPPTLLLPQLLIPVICGTDWSLVLQVGMLEQLQEGLPELWSLRELKTSLVCLLAMVIPLGCCYGGRSV